MTLFDVMKQASSYDTVAQELVTGMEISFEIGYAELMKTFHWTHDINIATVQTFLKILSKVPDTFIARKIGTKQISDIKEAVKQGRQESKWISKKAGQILDLGGLTTKEGTTALWALDEEMQKLGRDFNPGTTADLTASSLMIALLCGLKF